MVKASTKFLAATLVLSDMRCLWYRKVVQKSEYFFCRRHEMTGDGAAYIPQGSYVINQNYQPYKGCTYNIIFLPRAPDFRKSSEIRPHYNKKFSSYITEITGCVSYQDQKLLLFREMISFCTVSFFVAPYHTDTRYNNFSLLLTSVRY